MISQINDNSYFEKDVIDGQFELVEFKGEGGFAEVWKAFDTMGEVNVAIKLYKRMDDYGIQEFRDEYKKVKHLRNSYILKSDRFGVWNKGPYLVMDYCPNGSLFNRINHKMPTYEDELALILSQVTEGLEYMHEKEVYHMDIKPANILMYEHNHFVLTDFGISINLKSTIRKSINSQKNAKIDGGWTPEYAPPSAERYSIKPNPKSDIFSLGVTFWEIANLRLPFTDTGKAIESGQKIPDLKSEYSKELSDILKVCMSLEPNERPSAKELRYIARKYLGNSKWQCIPKKEIIIERVNCPNQNCGHLMSKSAKYCKNCGIDIVERMLPCRSCTNRIKLNKKFCPFCGRVNF